MTTKLRPASLPLLTGMGALLLVSLVPFASAALGPTSPGPTPYAPSSALLSWSRPAIMVGMSDTATVYYADAPTCPRVGTYSGTISITNPAGVTLRINTGPVHCGQSLSLVYPGIFYRSMTDHAGTYKAVFHGTTSMGVPFSVYDTFVAVTVAFV